MSSSLESIIIREYDTYDPEDPASNQNFNLEMESDQHYLSEPELKEKNQKMATLGNFLKERSKFGSHNKNKQLIEIKVELEANEENQWGLAINLDEEHENWVIEKVFAGFQADQRGIKAGWKLLKYDGNFITDKNCDEIKSKLVKRKSCDLTFQKYSSCSIKIETSQEEQVNDIMAQKEVSQSSFSCDMIDEEETSDDVSYETISEDLDTDTDYKQNAFNNYKIVLIVILVLVVFIYILTGVNTADVKPKKDAKEETTENNWMEHYDKESQNHQKFNMAEVIEEKNDQEEDIKKMLDYWEDYESSIERQFEKEKESIIKNAVKKGNWDQQIEKRVNEFGKKIKSEFKAKADQNFNERREKSLNQVKKNLKSKYTYQYEEERRKYEEEQRKYEEEQRMKELPEYWHRFETHIKNEFERRKNDIVQTAVDSGKWYDEEIWNKKIAEQINQFTNTYQHDAKLKQCPNFQEQLKKSLFELKKYLKRDYIIYYRQKRSDADALLSEYMNKFQKLIEDKFSKNNKDIIEAAVKTKDWMGEVGKRVDDFAEQSMYDIRKDQKYFSAQFEEKPNFYQTKELKLYDVKRHLINQTLPKVQKHYEDLNCCFCKKIWCFMLCYGILILIVYFSFQHGHKSSGNIDYGYIAVGVVGIIGFAWLMYQCPPSRDNIKQTNAVESNTDECCSGGSNNADACGEICECFNVIFQILGCIFACCPP